MRMRTNWKYFNVVKEIINSFKFRKRVRCIWSVDFSNVKAGGQEANVPSERNLNLKEKSIFPEHWDMSFDLRPRESVVKQSAGREESFMQLPFCVFSF